MRLASSGEHFKTTVKRNIKVAVKCSCSLSCLFLVISVTKGNNFCRKKTTKILLEFGNVK